MDSVIQSRIRDILTLARDQYEAGSGGGGEVPPTPFVFLLKDGDIRLSQVQVSIDDLVLEVVGKYGDNLIEQYALREVRTMAAQVKPNHLAGVGYLFAATGDFPQSEQEVILARLLRGQGASTPWAREGVIFLFDGPCGREAWGCLREAGEVADPLSDPVKLRVELPHIDPLYPYRLVQEAWE